MFGSAEVSETLSPPPPHNLTVESVERSKFRLTWETPTLPVTSDLVLLTHIVHFFETDGTEH